MNPSGLPQGRGPQGFFGKVVAVIAGAVLLVLGLMFSVVIIAVAVAFGLAIWGWVWWKTRALRQQMREQMDAQGQRPFGDPPATGGRVIEGEIISESRDDTRDPP